MFLLSPEDQRRLIERISGILVPGGRLLFTSPAEPIVWNDAMTGLESRSLGAAEYRRHMSAVGLSVASEYEDEGQNHYFDALKDAHYLANPDATPEAIHSDGLSPTRGFFFMASRGRLSAYPKVMRSGG